MIMLDPTSGYSIFCEYARAESNGLWTYIGVFPPNIEVTQAYPFNLRSLAIITVFQERFDELPQDVVIEISLLSNSSTEILSSALIPKDAREKTPTPTMPAFLSHEDNNVTMARVQSVTIFDGLTINDDSVIRVRAIVGDKTHRLGSFRVSSRQSLESTHA